MIQRSKNAAIRASNSCVDLNEPIVKLIEIKFVTDKIDIEALGCLFPIK